MVIRVTNALLLIANLIGLWYMLQAGQAYHRLRAEHQRLAAQVGVIEVRDPGKLHVLALDTGDPLHFAWQIYIPAGLTERYVIRAGGSSTGEHRAASPYFGMVRARLRKEQNGLWQLWATICSGSALMTLARQDSQLIDDRAALQIEQLGTQGVEATDDQQVATLLALSQKGNDKPLIALRIGTPQAFQALPGK